jgi:[ribosomal protein S18]-alanine N-acetyltransferase
MLAMINDHLPEQRPSRDDAFTERVMPFVILSIDEATVRTFWNWRYQPPYDLYNVGFDQAQEDELKEAVQFFLDPQNAYYSIVDQQSQLVAFCCFGWDAQVPGGDYRADALDVGIQMHPDMIGQEQGVIGPLLDFAQHTFTPTTFRVTIAALNTSELRVFEQVGFRAIQTFHDSGHGRPFVVLSRQV